VAGAAWLLLETYLARGWQGLACSPEDGGLPGHRVFRVMRSTVIDDAPEVSYSP